MAIPCICTLPWSPGLVDLARALQSALCPWEPCSCELFLWKLDFSNVGKQQGGRFKRLTDKQGLANCQLGQSSFFTAVISAVLRQSLRVKRCLSHGDPEDTSACSSPAVRPPHPPPFPRSAGTTTSTSLRPLGGTHTSVRVLRCKPHHSGSLGNCCAHSPSCKPHGPPCSALWVMMCFPPCPRCLSPGTLEPCLPLTHFRGAHLGAFDIPTDDSEGQVKWEASHHTGSGGKRASHPPMAFKQEC